MGDAALTFIYRPDGGGTPVPIGGPIRDPKLLRSARDILLKDMTERVDSLGELDSGLAALEAGELEKLRRVLSMIIPGPPLSSVK